MEERILPAKSEWGRPKYVIALLIVLSLAAIVIVSILRDRIMNPINNQITVVGRASVPYIPDTALVTIGAQIDKAPTAQDALNQLNARVAKITTALEMAGVKKENVSTQSYSVVPQYDFANNITTLSGYSANQQLNVKIEGIVDNTDQISKVISEANKAGANQILGVNFTVSNASDLKERARIMAIKDARAKAPELARAAGVSLDKIVGWYESIIQEPDNPQSNQVYGGGSGGTGGNGVQGLTQVPSGTQEIIMEVGMNYVIK